MLIGRKWNRRWNWRGWRRIWWKSRDIPTLRSDASVVEGVREVLQGGWWAGGQQLIIRGFNTTTIPVHIYSLIRSPWTYKNVYFFIQNSLSTHSQRSYHPWPQSMGFGQWLGKHTFPGLHVLSIIPASFASSSSNTSSLLGGRLVDISYL